MNTSHFFTNNKISQYIINEVKNNKNIIGISGIENNSQSSILVKVYNHFSIKKDNNIIPIFFNAYRYSNSNTIWAYIYERIFREYGNAKKRFLYIFKNTILTISNIILIFCTIGIYLALIIYLDKCTIISKDLLGHFKHHGITLVIISLTIKLIKGFINKPQTALKTISKYLKDVSIEKKMTLEYAIEKDIEKLLKTWINNNEKSRILLIIDNIDQSSLESQINIIKSLNNILENETIRKRVNIICKIDIVRLKEELTNKYKDSYPEKLLQENVRNKIDKLFSVCIKIPPLHIDKYIRKNYNQNTESNIYNHTDSKEYINELIKSINKEIKTNYKDLYIDLFKEEIIYNRIIDANKLHLYIKGEKINFDIAKAIYLKSLGLQYSINMEQANFVNMIVPY